MTQLTRTSRRGSDRSRTKLPPEFARSAGVDELPSGGGRGGGAFDAWRVPARDVMRGVIVSGQIKPRLCRLVD